MIWVAVFGGIALAGLIMVVSYAVWLWHKASDLFSELEMLGKRGSELAEILGGLRWPDAEDSQGARTAGSLD